MSESLSPIAAVSYSWHSNENTIIPVRALKTLIAGIMAVFRQYTVEITSNVCKKIRTDHKDSYFARAIASRQIKESEANVSRAAATNADNSTKAFAGRFDDILKDVIVQLNEDKLDDDFASVIESQQKGNSEKNVSSVEDDDFTAALAASKHVLAQMKTKDFSSLPDEIGSFLRDQPVISEKFVYFIAGAQEMLASIPAFRQLYNACLSFSKLFQDNDQPIQPPPNMSSIVVFAAKCYFSMPSILAYFFEEEVREIEAIGKEILGEPDTQPEATTTSRDEQENTASYQQSSYMDFFQKFDDGKAFFQTLFQRENQNQAAVQSLNPNSSQKNDWPDNELD